MERSAIQEFAVNEDITDTIMGTLLLAHSFAKAIKQEYGQEALTGIVNIIREGTSKDTHWSKEVLYVLSNQLEAVNLMV